MVDWLRLVELAGSLGAGGGLMAAGRWLGNRIDQPVTVLQVENQRLRDALEKLGEKHDALVTQRERELTQAAGVAYRIKQNSKLPDELADDMPTAVRDRAELLAPKSLPPKALPPTPPRRVVETYAPNARPTDPAPKGYDPKRR